METVINSIGNLLYNHRYIFAFLGAWFEGNYIMILSGVFYKFGFFKFWGLMAVLNLGYFLGGVMYYMMGRIGGQKVLEKWVRRLHLTKKLLLRLENYFKKHSVKTILITRITYGLAIPALIIAGSFRMKWKKFLIVNLISTIIWVFGAFALGYVFGISYSALGKITKTIAVGLAIALFVIMVFLTFFVFHWFMRSIKLKFMKRLENNRFQLIRKIGSAFNYLINGKNKQKKQNNKEHED